MNDQLECGLMGNVGTAGAWTPPGVPAGHRGPVYLVGSGRLVFWTGRVAIGLRHEPQRSRTPSTQSSIWVQELLLAPSLRQA